MANMTRRLVGGTAGEPEGFGGHPFFHSGVKALQFLSKNTYGARILPAFDINLPPDSPDFKLSVSGYRDTNSGSMSADGAYPFSSFYYILKGYKFLGNDKKQFLSPLNGQERDNRGIDPLLDIYLTAKNSKVPEWEELIKKPENKVDGYSAVLPWYSKFGVMNCAVHIEKGDLVENRLIVCGIACLDMLKDTLNRKAPRDVQDIVDPNWPDYLFGDVTSLEYGSWATVKKTTFNKADMSDAGFHFSSKADSLTGRTHWPIDINDPGSRALLEGRYDIGDTETVTKIWSAEEILAYIVADGFLPYELIVQACSNTWVVPEESRHPTHSLPPEGTPESAPAVDGGGALRRPAPATTAQRQAPRTSAPAAPANLRTAAPVTTPAAPANTTPRPPVAPAGGAPRPPGAQTSTPRPPGAPSGAPKPPGAQNAAPRPPGAPGGAPRPPGAPVAQRPPPSPARPPGAGTTPATTQPPQVQQAPAVDNSNPDLAPVGEAAQVDPGQGGPLSEAEVADLNELQARFDADTNSLNPEEMQRFGALAQRSSQQ